MYFYKHHIGDFMRDTAALSMIEECVYRRLLDAYYATERPLPLNFVELTQIARAKRAHEKRAVAAIAKRYFLRSKDGYHNKRADQEIGQFKAKSESAAKSAAARWHASALRSQCEGNAIQNQNQEPSSGEDLIPPTPPFEKGGTGRKRRSEHRREQDEAVGIWNRLLESGGEDPPRTERLQSAINAAGGWSAIQTRDAFHESKLRAAFCEAYASRLNGA
jgi:uncharacterized protein YdaU (DUF1376 family)